jgi:hypothetical protein
MRFGNTYVGTSSMERKIPAFRFAAYRKMKRAILRCKTCPFERQYTAFCKVSFNGQGNTSLFHHNSFQRCTVSSQHLQCSYSQNLHCTSP